MSLHNDKLSGFWANQSLSLLLNAVCLAEKHLPIYSLWFDPMGLISWSTTLKVRILTITPLMLFYMYIQRWTSKKTIWPRLFVGGHEIYQVPKITIYRGMDKDKTKCPRLFLKGHKKKPCKLCKRRLFFQQSLF